MDNNKRLAWLKKVYRTEAEEVLCSVCLDQIDVYVDRALQGQDMARRMPAIHQHLEQCAVCQEEYELLRSLVEAESGNDVFGSDVSANDASDV